MLQETILKISCIALNTGQFLNDFSIGHPFRCNSHHTEKCGSLLSTTTLKHSFSVKIQIAPVQLKQYCIT